MLTVSDGDVITAIYHDADDGTGNAAMATDSATADCAAPEMLDMAVTDVGHDSFTVELQTSELATVEIIGGSDCGATDFIVTSRLSSTHTLEIDGLTSCTKYRFRLVARDEVGNTTLDDNGGLCYEINTGDLELLFGDSFEPSPLAGWTHVGDIDNWNFTASEFARSPEIVYAFQPGADLVTDSFLISPVFENAARLSFWHTFNLEDGFDGGVLELSTDGGMNWIDLGANIIEGGYNGRISTCCENPLGGRLAWTGGELGRMTQVVVDVSEFSGPRQVRFRFGSDASLASVGWLIDDFEVSRSAPCLSEAGRIEILVGAYRCGAMVEFRVLDMNATSGTLTVELSTGAGDFESALVFDEDGDKRYGGLLPLGGKGDAVVPEDGVLQGAEDDFILARYTDEDDGDGSRILSEDTSRLDCIAPLISEVSVGNVSGRTAEIFFRTNEPSTGRVFYSNVCGDLYEEQFGLVGATSHTVRLNGLRRETLYFFKLEAVDEAGNSVEDDNGDSCNFFTTEYEPDFYTELIVQETDLQFTKLTFIPTQGADFYTVCRETVTEFPTNPANGAPLDMDDDDSIFISLHSDAQVWLFGKAYAGVYVGGNGYLTFGGSDQAFRETLGNHFDLPRVSAQFDDLDASDGGFVSWKQLSDRFVATWQDVPQWDLDDSNNFQVELFFNGVVTITRLGIDAEDGLVGLSEGFGVPSGFLMSDLSATESCQPSIVNSEGRFSTGGCL